MEGLINLLKYKQSEACDKKKSTNEPGVRNWYAGKIKAYQDVIDILEACLRNQQK